MSWFVQICLALEYMHERKTLHRDIKTHNVFLTDQDKIKLGDLGVAKVFDQTTDLAMTMMGTPLNLSPEIIKSEPYSFKSDVWALGCTLFELCTLSNPFNAKNMLNLANKIVNAEPDHAISEMYSDGLRSLVKAMLNKDPHARPMIKDVL
jgi:NIMA (never in mitosis gene a)-related kinase 1/4/5